MRRRASKSRWPRLPAAGLLPFPCGVVANALAQRPGGMAQADPFKPSDGVNNPIGVAQGIHLGRVAWARDPKATSWDGTTGHWWTIAHSDRARSIA
jgi:hypothetical protein